MSEHADFSRACEGCEYIRTELWPVKGSYSNTAVAYRCFAPGPHKGYHMGTARLLPYVPAQSADISAKQRATAWLRRSAPQRRQIVLQ